MLSTAAVLSAAMLMPIIGFSVMRPGVAGRPSGGMVKAGMNVGCTRFFFVLLITLPHAFVTGRLLSVTRFCQDELAVEEEDLKEVSKASIAVTVVSGQQQLVDRQRHSSMAYLRQVRLPSMPVEGVWKLRTEGGMQESEVSVEAVCVTVMVVWRPLLLDRLR